MRPLCPKCNGVMRLLTTIDDNWKVYRCPNDKEEVMRHFKTKCYIQLKISPNDEYKIKKAASL